MLRTRTTAAWVVLVVATLVSVAIGEDHGVGSTIALVVLAVAALKVCIVGLELMELRRAPRLLRLAFELYCLLLWGVLGGLYLWA